MFFDWLSWYFHFVDLRDFCCFDKNAISFSEVWFILVLLSGLLLVFYALKFWFHRVLLRHSLIFWLQFWLDDCVVIGILVDVWNVNSWEFYSLFCFTVESIIKHQYFILLSASFYWVNNFIARFICSLGYTHNSLLENSQKQKDNTFNINLWFCWWLLLLGLIISHMGCYVCDATLLIFITKHTEKGVQHIKLSLHIYICQREMGCVDNLWVGIRISKKETL